MLMHLMVDHCPDPPAAIPEVPGLSRLFFLAGRSNANSMGGCGAVVVPAGTADPGAVSGRQRKQGR